MGDCLEMAIALGDKEELPALWVSGLWVFFCPVDS